MKNILKITTIVLFAGFSSGCSDFFEPEIDGAMTEEQIFKNAAYFCGPLMEAYKAIPELYEIGMDNMTDNAVSNDYKGSFQIAGTGGLRPDNNPLNNWDGAYLQIRHVNQFLSKMEFHPERPLPTPVRFFVLYTPADSVDNVREYERLLGEAYFVRAFWESQLLRHFGGMTAGGQLAGVPIVGDKVLEITDNLNLPRASYDECVQQILSDCDSAVKYLPVTYKGESRVTGASMNGRASGGAALALKARMLLYAASPAFNPSNDVTRWQKAAIAAGKAIKAIDGLQNLSTIDNFYFAQLNNKKFENKDILFRSNIVSGNRKFEKDNYPQSMYGSASTNPTQNFVDAFPDSKGFPITESSFDFSAEPFQNRDPRLATYIGINGSKMGKGNYHQLECYKGGEDAYLPLKQTSRTSYYLKKLLRTNQITLIPGEETGTQRTLIHLGLPELYLTYAEAANEAWGVKGDPEGFGFTAYDALRKIQIRGNCGADYLNTRIGASQDLFRAYIRNERRIELSFEGHYFFDLRRWCENNSTATLNQDVYGLVITRQADNSFTYEKKFLEKKSFQSPYLPISYTELANSPLLQQNYGWN